MVTVLRRLDRHLSTIARLFIFIEGVNYLLVAQGYESPLKSYEELGVLSISEQSSFDMLFPYLSSPLSCIFLISSSLSSLLKSFPVTVIGKSSLNSTNLGRA